MLSLGTFNHKRVIYITAKNEVTSGMIKYLFEVNLKLF